MMAGHPPRRYAVKGDRRLSLLLLLAMPRIEVGSLSEELISIDLTSGVPFFQHSDTRGRSDHPAPIALGATDEPEEEKPEDDEEEERAEEEEPASAAQMS